jgi:phosphomannomutase
MAHLMNLSAFRSYDVRGVYPSEINEELAASVARAFASRLHADKVVLGMDARDSSPSLHRAIQKALIGMGVDVYDIGLCTTPLLNYAVVARGFIGGIMISASHNSKEFNAMKLIRQGIQLSSPGELDEIKELVERKEDLKPIKERMGDVFTLDVLNDYVKEIIEHFAKVKGLKVIVDYSSGMGSITAKPVFEKLGLDVIALNEKIDCTFPVHSSDPTHEENVKQLRERVVAESADCGIIFDGDADRSFIIDNLGRVVLPDIITAMLAPHELSGRSEKRIYYDLRFSRVVPEVIAAHRGIPIVMRVGNPYYKERLRNDGGIFAAELSGHMMFQDHYCIDDGLYAALKVLKSMMEHHKKLSDMVQPLKRYHITPELDFTVHDAEAVINRVKEAFKNEKNIPLDGLYIVHREWWFNLRKSNTGESVVRLRIEASTQEKLEELKGRIVALIKD